MRCHNRWASSAYWCHCGSHSLEMNKRLHWRSFVRLRPARNKQLNLSKKRRTSICYADLVLHKTRYTVKKISIFMGNIFDVSETYLWDTQNHLPVCEWGRTFNRMRFFDNSVTNMWDEVICFTDIWDRAAERSPYSSVTRVSDLIFP